MYKITGVRGSGKTVILAKIENELRHADAEKNSWIVIDVNSSRDMLAQIAASLVKAGFGKSISKTKSVTFSANMLGSGIGLGVSSEKDETFF